MGNARLGCQCCIPGFRIGTTPQVGAIAIWDGGQFGHVAYVTAVANNRAIQVLSQITKVKNKLTITVVGLTLQHFMER